MNKEELFEKLTRQWMNDNPILLEDLDEIARKVTLFNMKWGTNLNLTTSPLNKEHD